MCFGRCEDLEDSIPAHINICVSGLSVIFTVRPHDEPVVGMDVASLVNGMVTGAETPGGIASLVTVMEVVLIVVLRTGRQGKVHKVGDGSLTLSAVD